MVDRYSRQELFSGIGKQGQERIKAASVVIVGCGALGSLQSEVLVRAGVGRITIIDRDFVEVVKLQRQALFTEQDAGTSFPKAVAATNRLKSINSEVQIDPVVSDLSAENAHLLVGHDIILDGTDNFQTRYLLNDIAWKEQIPWIYGACVGSGGISCAFIPPDFPCLRCVFEAEPAPGTAPTCDTAGILWSAVGQVVSYQVSALFQILCGIELRPQIFQFDIWESRFHVVSIRKAKRSNCPTCGVKRFPSLTSQSDFETSLCGRDAVQVKPGQKTDLDLEEFEARWKQIGESFRNPFLVKLRLESNEIVLFPDGRAIIKGTADPVRARNLYAKYVGN